MPRSDQPTHTSFPWHKELSLKITLLQQTALKAALNKFLRQQFLGGLLN